MVHFSHDQVRSTRYRGACMIRCMNVDEAIGVCEDRSRWRSEVSAYLRGKKREFMYVCMYRFQPSLSHRKKACVPAVRPLWARYDDDMIVMNI